jgi:hypothetical protein
MKLKQWLDNRIAWHRAKKLLRSRFPEGGGKYELDEWDQAFRDLGLPKPDTIDFMKRIRDQRR